MSAMMELQRQINDLQRDVERLKRVERWSLRRAEYTNTLTQAFTVNAWYNVIPSNTLANTAIYIIDIQLSNESAEPWTVSAATLLRPILTNAGAYADAATPLLTSTHTASGGAPAQFEMRTAPVAGYITPVVQIRLLNTGAPAGSILTINARRVM